MEVKNWMKSLKEVETVTAVEIKDLERIQFFLFNKRKLELFMASGEGPSRKEKSGTGEKEDVWRKSCQRNCDDCFLYSETIIYKESNYGHSLFSPLPFPL